MTIVKSTVSVTALRSPAEIKVKIDTDGDYVISVDPTPVPNIVVEPTEIPIVGAAILGPQGMQGEQGEQGEVGPPGPSTPTHTHNQLAPAYDWTVIHPLNKYPSVMVVDSGDTVLEPDIRYDSASQLTVTFGAPTSGKAYLN